MIVITSDHGDYLGDHYLGEKGMLHEQSAKIPMIVYDPSPEADSGRGTVCDELVESIDLAATFVDFAGGDVPDHIIEGHSLTPFLRGETPETWRDYAISANTTIPPPRCARRLASRHVTPVCSWSPTSAGNSSMPRAKVPTARSARCCSISKTTPKNSTTSAVQPDHFDIIDRMYERLGKWGRRLSQRTTRSEEQKSRPCAAVRGAEGVVLGLYDGSEVSGEFTVKYRGKAPKRPGPAR